MKCKLKQEFECVFYDGTLIGDVGEKGKVLEQTSPQWIPAISEEFEDPGLARAATHQRGVLSRATNGQLFIPCQRERRIHMARPGDYIIRGIRGEIKVVGPKDFKEQYDVC